MFSAFAGCWMRGWRKELLGHKSCIDSRELRWNALRVEGSIDDVCRFVAGRSAE